MSPAPLATAPALLDPRQALAGRLPGAQGQPDASLWAEVSALLLEPLVQGLAHGGGLGEARPLAEDAAQGMLCQHLARADGLGLGRLMTLPAAAAAEKKPKT